MTPDDRPVRPGRPRVVPNADSALSPRDQILDAAAALFVENGISATSTRAIAERVGIRQASLYYHFAGKDDMLVELLTTSVRPSLELVRGLEQLVPESASAAGALAALVVADVDTLARTPHNIGTLYLLPEVQGERYDGFRAERVELQEAYGRLGSRAATPDVAAGVAPSRLGAVLIQITETVIQLRRSGPVQDADRDALVATCLRACGLDTAAVAEARRDAESLLAAVAVWPSLSPLQGVTMTTITPAAHRPLADALLPRTAVVSTTLVLGGALLTAGAAQVSVPIWPVPITGQTLAVLLVGSALGARRGALSMLVYALLGVVGLPVFADGSAGVGVLVGPSGGYIVGFVAAAALVGWVAERFGDRPLRNALLSFALGTVVTFVAGMAWLAVALGLDLQQTLQYGLYPFVLGGVVKTLIGAGVISLGWTAAVRSDTRR